MKRFVQITNWSSPLPRPIRAHYCSGFLCKLHGFMFRRHIQDDEGLLFVQDHENRLDTSIHMFFVFTDLTVIWMNKSGVIVDTVLAKSWHPAYFPKTSAKYILELSPIQISNFSIGDMIKIE